MDIARLMTHQLVGIEPTGPFAYVAADHPRGHGPRGLRVAGASGHPCRSVADPASRLT